jgi:HTH-type transcriptional regulator / antitoxin MqsA
MANPVCPETGAPMHRDQKPMTLKYQGESITFDMPGWYCKCCDQSIHSGEDMKVSDRMLNRLKANVEGLMVPEYIRDVRKKLGISQVTAGEIIGGGPRAFQKYESGDLLPSRALNTALSLLAHSPQLLSQLPTPKSKSSRKSAK